MISAGTAENAGHEYGRAIPQNGIVTKRDVFLRGERALSVCKILLFFYVHREFTRPHV